MVPMELEARAQGKLLKLRATEPYESALVRLKLKYCKRGRCGTCPVRGTAGDVRPEEFLKCKFRWLHYFVS